MAAIRMRPTPPTTTRPRAIHIRTCQPCWCSRTANPSRTRRPGGASGARRSSRCSTARCMAECPPTCPEQVRAKGWAYAVLSTSTIQADNGAGLTKGIIGLVNRGQPRKPDDWGALRAWAWGASRLLDHLETVPEVDAKRAVIEGV